MIQIEFMACHTLAKPWESSLSPLLNLLGVLKKLNLQPGDRGVLPSKKLCWPLLTYSESGDSPAWILPSNFQQENLTLQMFLLKNAHVWWTGSYTQIPFVLKWWHYLSRHPATMIIFQVLWHYRSVDNFVQFTWAYRMISHRNCRTRVTHLHSLNWWATYQFRKDLLIFLDLPYICKKTTAFG